MATPKPDFLSMQYGYGAPYKKEPESDDWVKSLVVSDNRQKLDKAKRGKRTFDMQTS